MFPSKIDFKIEANGPASRAFKELNISFFSNACQYVKAMPYQRNSHKKNALVVLAEKCGTCSTKHALLKMLAQENGAEAISLRLGIYRMHAGNATAVGPILESNQLRYIPEAHYFLRLDGQILDFTFPDFEIPNLVEELLWETEVQPYQIGAAKDQIHRDFLTSWLAMKPEIRLSLEGLWQVREKCIFALSQS